MRALAGVLAYAALGLGLAGYRPVLVRHLSFGAWGQMAAVPGLVRGCRATPVFTISHHLLVFIGYAYWGNLLLSLCLEWGKVGKAILNKASSGWGPSALLPWSFLGGSP